MIELSDDRKILNFKCYVLKKNYRTGGLFQMTINTRVQYIESSHAIL